MKEREPNPLSSRLQDAPIALFAVAVAFVSLIQRSSFIRQDSWALAFGEQGFFQPLLHLDSNAFLIWPSPLGPLLPVGALGHVIYTGLLLLLAACGAIFAAGRRPAVGAAAVVVLVLCVGCDTVVLSCAAFFLLGIGFFQIKGSALSRAGSSLAGCWFGALTASVVGCGAFLVLLLAAITAGEIDSAERAERGFSTQLRFRVAALAVAFLALQFLPGPTFPDYPPGTHVVAGYGVVEGLQPLLGTEPPVQVIDRTAIREELQRWGPELLCLTFALLMVTLFVRAGNPRFALMAFLLAGALVLESGRVAITVSQIAPIQSYSRVIPEQVYLPLVAIATGLAVVCLVVGTGLLLSPRRAWTQLVVATLCAIGFAAIDARPLLKSGPARHAAKQDVLNQYDGIIDSTERDRLKQIVLSPSFAIFERFGLRETLGRRALSDKVTPTGLPVASKVTASTREDLLPLLRDGDAATRWSPSLGVQQPGEWIGVRFHEPFTLVGVRLGTGPFYTDFPRGIEVRTSDACDQPGAIAVNGKTVAVDQPWEGPLVATPRGYPALASQYDVSVVFSKAITTKCLVIVLTGGTPSFDWSVSELSLLVLQEESGR